MIKDKIKNFTTTLNVEILNELDRASKELNMAKNDVLTNAFLNWNNERKQRLVAKSYELAKNDSDWKKLSDEGIGDWSNQISKWK